MPRKQKKYHYIYKTTCQVTGKFYVGMHSTDNLEDDYLGSGKVLGYSIGKHGRENHKKEILEFLPDRVALKAREAEVVNEELLANPLCINLKYGGEGGWDHLNDGSESHRRRCASAGVKSNMLHKKSWHLSREDYLQIAQTKRANGTIGNGFLGKQHTAETREKMRKPKNQGESNSQFGTCWVIKEDRPIKINKHDLEEYLAMGFQRGRKMRP